MRRALLTIPAIVLAAVAGCGVLQESSGDDATGTQGGEIRELERRAIGAASEYDGKALSTEEEETLRTSKRKRRELGWKVLAKVLQPVAIAEQSGIAAGTGKIPLFRTWHGGDEFQRMFGKMVDDLGPARRARRDGATADELKSLFQWNATTLGLNSERDYFDRLSRVTAQDAVEGFGGNARVAYSPAYLRKYFSDYGNAINCEKKLAGLDLDTPPTSETNFTNCFGSEFAPDAAVLKASWRRNDDVLHGIPVHDTTPSTLRKRVAGTDNAGGWPREPALAEAGPDKIYTVKLSRGEKYSLGALHVMTKELRHWVWVTIWWSETPDRDFGQDRPKEIRGLGGPWSNYKMCVVTSFDEGDADPRGGFSGSLGDAMAAVHGTETWCSNPFIEKEAHNAQTNCIGCHQHAGDPKQLSTILGREKQGRTLVRKSFPADYSWSFATPDSPGPKDRFLRVMSQQVRAYDGEDVPADPSTDPNDAGTR